ncbi:MAG: hypothetical protein KatS3mg102_2237 [Planctomycetota bacterium]|nr:MAG: hypothetical protein KatS3mg102_2237 [Planctomycetota bacterium]
MLDLRWLGRDSEGLYAVYEDRGGEPATRRASRAPLDRIRAARVLKHVARAAQDAAAGGVLVRELRPEAVLLGEDAGGEGEEAIPTLAAWGAMRLCEPPAEGVPDCAADPFVPPERKRKADRADARTGIYGLGALLVLLLTGSGPGEGELPEVPAAMRSFLDKTLNNATGKRYLDFDKVFFDLDRCPGAKGLEVETRR